MADYLIAFNIGIFKIWEIQEAKHNIEVRKVKIVKFEKVELIINEKIIRKRTRFYFLKE